MGCFGVRTLMVVFVFEFMGGGGELLGCVGDVEYYACESRGGGGVGVDLRWYNLNLIFKDTRLVGFGRKLGVLREIFRQTVGGTDHAVCINHHRLDELRD